MKQLLFTAITASMVVISCNPASEDIKDPLWNSLHNSKPFQSDYFHSADYRFPHNACDEPQCHATDLTGGNSGAPSCYSCHDDQWTIFGVSHTRKISGRYHKNSVDEYPTDRDSNTNWFKEAKYNCADALCHGANLDGTQGGPSANFAYRYSCKVCHSSDFDGSIPPPGHSVRQSEEGKTGWHHYNYGNANPEGVGTNTACAGLACHGLTGKTSVAASGLFGRSPACGECH